MSLVEREDGEQGFMLLGLIVVIFLILLALSVAAPRVARSLRREREVETVRRGNQYVRAIQLYYRKFGHYPGSMEQLEKSNNMRFLRQQYVDPLTGKADWRIIKVGEAKTTVKGFFGKPLTGLTPGLGSAAGMASSGGIGAGAAGASPTGSAFGSSGPGGSALGGASTTGTSGIGGATVGSPGSSTAGTTAGTGTTGAAGSTDSTGFGSSQSDSLTGGSGPFVGVGLVKDGDSIITLNEQSTYPTWEFIYDPRIEQLKAQAALNSGASSAGSASGFGSGSTPGSGFGSSTGTGFGGSSSGTSSSPTSTSPATSGSGSAFPQQ